MSPRSTLKSCGSSSIDVRRSKRPIGVIRGSSRDLEHRPVRFVLRLERGLQALGVLHHRAELEHAEPAAVQAVALLAEKNRARARRGDGHGGDERAAG